MRRFWIVATFLFTIGNISAQISVTAGFSRDSVQIGEAVNYIVTAKVNPQTIIKSVDIYNLDSIVSVVQTQIAATSDTTGSPEDIVGDYTIQSFGRWSDDNDNKQIDGNELSWDTTVVGNELLLENTFQISFWDAGPNVIKTPNVTYGLGGITSPLNVNHESYILVSVPFAEQELSDSVDIAPIRDILREEKNITDYYPIFYAIAALLLIPILFFLYKKFTNKEIEPVKEVEVILPAHIVALDKLEELRISKLWQKGEIKKYQSELTYTIREYLENRYDIQALESSTDEIVKALKESNFDSSDETDLKTILQVADLVKFAKAKPSEEIHEEFLNTAFSFVRKTKLEETIKPDSEI